MDGYHLLDKINKPNDIKKLPKRELPALAAEIRHFLLENVSKTGGHLSSNLGVVELTIALHRFLDFPEDKLVFDVGHQAYVHKILTGRKNFESLRQLGGLSGFPKSEESECDAFDTGHSSTALSVAAGLAAARDLKGEHHKVVAVVGDGALGGGLAFEALNNLIKFKSNLIIILNDNSMSIDKNVGGVANYLGHVRTNTSYINFKNSLSNALLHTPGIGPVIFKKMKHSKNVIKSMFVGGMFFEDLGITYIGPIDGHDVGQVMTALENASRVERPILIHAVTKKGKGYSFAEKNPGKFHGIAPFDVATGKLIKKNEHKTYTEAFSEEMIRLSEKNDMMIGITAAMEFGTGLNEFSKKYPNRFFDVGIAEQHAVTFAAGLSKEGFIPVVAIYSSFLQRSYDQVLHDVCLTHRHVVLMIDRSGITGADGETHQGIFDLSYLSHIPGLTVMAPKNCEELKKMLEFTVSYDGPVAIRYPRGEENGTVSDLPSAEVEYGRAEKIEDGADVAIFAVGSVVDTGLRILDKLKEDGIGASLYNVRFVSPIDKDAILKEAARCKAVVTIEENVRRGGFGEAVADILEEAGVKTAFIGAALDDSFIEHGKRTELLKLHGIDPEKIYDEIRCAIGK